MNLKKIYVSIGMVLILLCGVIVVSCTTRSPEIQKVIMLSDITKEEYLNLRTENKPKGTLINDFKKIYINVKIINSIKSPQRKISIPDLSSIINNYDRVRAVTSGDSLLNNIETDDIAEYTAFVIFDSRGLSEQSIRNMYSNSAIKVSYELKNGEIIDKQFSIGTYLEVTK